MPTTFDLHITDLCPKVVQFMALQCPRLQIDVSGLTCIILLSCFKNFSVCWVFCTNVQIVSNLNILFLSGSRLGHELLGWKNSEVTPCIANLHLWPLLIPSALSLDNNYICLSRPYSRLWWDEIVPTVLTVPDSHSQVNKFPNFDGFPSKEKVLAVQFYF